MEQSALSKTSLFSRFFLRWLNPIIETGNQRKLNLDDLPHLPLCDKSNALKNKLEKHWKAEYSKSSNSSRSNCLLKAILKTFRSSILLISGIRLIDKCCLVILERLLLGYVIQYLMSPENEKNVEFYTLGFGLIIVTILKQLTLHSYYYLGENLGLKIRTACTSLLHSKILKLKQISNQKNGISEGQIVNLVSNDGNRLETCFEVHLAWIIPIQMILFIWILWSHFGVSCLVGVILAIVLAICQVYLGKVSSKFRAKVANATDSRLRLMTEIINAIHTIKIYAWEIPFSKLVKESRKNEEDVLRNSHHLRRINWCFHSSSAVLSLFSTIFIYVFTNGNELTAEKVFVCTTIYIQLCSSLTIDFPKAIQQIGDFVVSARRFQEVLSDVEIEDKNTTNESETPKEFKQPCVQLSNFSCSWDIMEMNSSVRVLSNINMSVKEPGLISIIGGVGCGKTSVLLSILNEIPYNSGFIDIAGKISYAPQMPFLFPGTIRENILFGKGYDKDRYETVITACALDVDFEEFPNGDLTSCAEIGSSLSGGQKARVGLARAAYHEADIYLLDDPLSSLDPQVAQHVLEQCINGILKYKIRLLVTQHLEAIQSSKYVYVLDEGKITIDGIPDKVLEKYPHNNNNCIVKKPEAGSSPNFWRSRNSSIVAGDGTIPKKDSDHGNSTYHQGLSSEVYYKYAKSGLSSKSICCKIIFLSIGIHFLQFGAKYILGLCLTRNIPMNFQLLLYIAIPTLLITVSYIQITEFLKVLHKSSQMLHDNMLSALLKAPYTFFTENSKGAILERFSSDQSKVDELLPFTIFYVFHVLGECIASSFLACLSINFYMLFLFGVLMYADLKLLKKYLRTSRSISSLETASRSPTMSHFISTLQGIHTIRVFGMSQFMNTKCNNLINIQAKVKFMKNSLGVWISSYIDLLMTLFIDSLILLAMMTTVGGVEFGLSLTSLISLGSLFGWAIHQLQFIELEMKSTENILKFHDIRPEEPNHFESVNDSSEEWSIEGKVELKELSMRYTKTRDPVLKNLSLNILPGENVTILGRTGAGKSSIINALLRIIEPSSGTVLIDGYNITNVKLNSLRSKISVIPQDPILFEGTLRFNLDPFNQYKDNDLLEALGYVNWDKGQKLSLNMEITKGGQNLSVGQRQLLCMARAFLRKNKIIILDEATAFVDIKTSKLIQTKLRDVFSNCTIITIQHRLTTLMDYDKVIVIDNGRVVEIDRPETLLKNPTSFLVTNILSEKCSIDGMNGHGATMTMTAVPEAIRSR